jgi:NitT/TauT family transport system permease protein
LVYPAGTLLVLLGAWEIWVRVGAPVAVLPPVSDVLAAMVVKAPVLMPQALMTLRVIVLGFLIAIAVAIPLAAFMVAWRPFERSMYPLLIASQVIPKIAIAPLILVWFGFTLTSKLLIVFLLAFFPIVIDSVDGLRALDVRKVQLGKSMGASGFQIFMRFRFPNALPTIFTGLKVGAVLAVTGAVIAEFISVGDGLGNLIIRANARLDTVTAFASVGYLAIMGFAIFYAVGLAEKLLLSWHVSQRETGA